MRSVQLVVFPLLVFLLSGCGEAGIGIATLAPADDPATPEPTFTVQPPATPTPPPAAFSFEPATYQDDTLGFELKYPAIWEVPVLFEEQSRGTIMQASMNGEVQMDIVTLRWDPVNDLPAFLEVREQAFDGSGFTILARDEIALAQDWHGVGYTIETSSGDRAYFFFTPVADRYLQLSGSGDIGLLAEIAASVRALE